MKKSTTSKDNNYNKNRSELIKELKEKLKKIEELEKESQEWKRKLDEIQKENKILAEILNSRKTPYEKKIALFNMVKNLEVGDMPPEKRKRVNFLLQAHLYSDLAKQSMKDYKKTTAESFSKAE